MPRSAAVLVALALVTASSTAAMSRSPVPTGFTVTASAALYEGVTYAKLAKPKTPVVAHVARVAPGAPVDLRVVNANDKISTSPRELELTSGICGRVQCIVGLNGDFHRAGTPAGAVVADGRMLHSPQPARPQLTVTGDGRLIAGPLPWTGSLTAADGTKIPVTAVNANPAGEDGLALFTPAFGPHTEASSRVELLVRAPGGVGALNRSTELVLRGIRSGAGPIPADGAVLAGEGLAARQLQELWGRVQSGVPSRAQLMVSSPIDAKFSLGVEPVVLRDGRRALPWRDPNVINPRQPHTLVGWNKVGETFLVAVDGRQPGSEGMTMAEAADFLLALGATEAVNLDGGGGTTFVAGGSVWNRPSDNDPVRPTEYEERGTANALVVMARPGAPLPAASPPPPPKPVTRPASPANPANGPGDTAETLPWDDGPSYADHGMPFGAFADGGGQLADGELPVGPGRGTRAAAAPGGVQLSEPGMTAPTDPGPGAVPPGGSDGGPADLTGATGTVPSSLSGQEPEPTASGGSRRLQATAARARPAAVGVAVAAAAGLVALAIKRRRRRVGSLSLLIEGRGRRGARPVTGASGQHDEIVAMDHLVRRPLGQVAGAGAGQRGERH